MVAVGGVPMLAGVIDAVAEVGASPIVVVGPDRGGLPSGITVVREEPVGGGPVAAAVVGIAEVVRLAEKSAAGHPAERASEHAREHPAERAPDHAPEHTSEHTSEHAAEHPAEHVVERGGERAVVDEELGVVALLAADLPYLSGRAIRVLVRGLGAKDGAVFVDGEGRRQLLCGVWRVAALRRAIEQFGEPSGGSLKRLIQHLEVNEVRWDGARAPYFDCDTEEDLESAEKGESGKKGERAEKGESGKEGAAQ
ncbi:molybdenum cofactor guanylyltransferase [Dactylosporangium sp. CS-047395]|uniref:molybdenum cofactor guanylyltransferase n=1 Tax=Dactylosporangium sp. CS-047395 TaxID=3239936 RepID=UPI003D8F5B52